jgi:hypothetical protein
MGIKRPRLLVIYPYPSIDSNPTMVLLLESLAQIDLEIDILLVSGEDFLVPESFGDNINLYYLPNTFFQIQWGFLKRFLFHVVLNRFRPRIPSLLFLDPYLYKYARLRTYSLIIGIDPGGIVLADFLNGWAGHRLVYISFELIYSDEVAQHDEQKILKMERKARQHISLVIIQDEERAQEFCSEQAFPRANMVQIPVAPSPQTIIKSNYLRRKLGIDQGKKIVLYSGALEAWASRDEFAEMVSYWSDRFCLVVHSRSKLDSRVASYYSKLAKTGKIYVSNDPVPRRMMTHLISSADFGLAPYKPIPDGWWTGKNIYHLGLSSGKVSYYAMCGLPILARSLPVFETEFREYECGKIYDRLSDTGELLDEMQCRYSHYRDESLRFYRERLNPTGKMQLLCEQLLELSK